MEEFWEEVDFLLEDAFYFMTEWLLPSKYNRFQMAVTEALSN